MFSICSHMRWAHLPVAGGLYDQDPELLRKFEILFNEVNEHEKRESAKQKAQTEAKRNQKPSRTPMRGGRMRR